MSSADSCECPTYRGRKMHYQDHKPMSPAFRTELRGETLGVFENVVLMSGLPTIEQISEKLFYLFARRALANGGCRQ